MVKIILATSSIYRQEAFSQLELDFTAENPRIDEYYDGRPTNPEELVRQLSRLKAEYVAEKKSEGIIIGFDSVGWYYGSILENPKSEEEAYERLKRLSGKEHKFFTGIYMIDKENGHEPLSRVSETQVSFRELSESEITGYLESDSRFNTYSLGYDPLDHYSSSFVDKITGSFSSFIRAFPSAEVVKMLKHMGYESDGRALRYVSLEKNKSAPDGNFTERRDNISP